MKALGELQKMGTHVQNRVETCDNLLDLANFSAYKGWFSQNIVIFFIGTFGHDVGKFGETGRWTYKLSKNAMR